MTTTCGQHVIVSISVMIRNFKFSQLVSSNSNSEKEKRARELVRTNWVTELCQFQQWFLLKLSVDNFQLLAYLQNCNHLLVVFSRETFSSPLLSQYLTHGNGWQIVSLLHVLRHLNTLDAQTMISKE